MGSRAPGHCCTVPKRENFFAMCTRQLTWNGKSETLLRNVASMTGADIVGGWKQHVPLF